MLTGRPPVGSIDRNGAPARRAARPARRSAGHRRGRPGARGSALTLAQRWALPFLRAGRQTVVFGRSRVAVEIMLSNLREALREDLGPRSRIRGYRGGYLPTERRAIERGLRDGEILGVVARTPSSWASTSAALDVVDPRRLPGLDRRDVAADGPGRPARRDVSVGDPRRVGRAGRPVRHPPPGVPARRRSRRRRGSTRTTSTSCSRTCAARRSSCRSSRARCSGPGRRTTCSRSSASRATSARPTTGAGTGARRTSRPRRSRCGRPRPRTS